MASTQIRPHPTPIVEEGALAARPHPIRKRILVVGGGQAGLSVGYHLKQLGIEDFLIVDGSARIGDAWRKRWDSLRLFTPAAYDGLDGMPFPAPRGAAPGKDHMADYLEAYARRFDLPVLLETRIDRLASKDGHFVLRAGEQVFEANRVIVAMSNYQRPRIPPFAPELSPAIRQFDTGSYRNPAQLAPGSVLIVGAANSGAEIARDLAATHHVIVAGRKVNEIPGTYAGFFNQRVMVPLLNRVVFPYIMSVETPIGRRARQGVMKSAVPLIRVKSRDLAALGVTRVGRVAGARDGLPLLEDGTRLDVDNVVWCCGLDAGLDWIALPVLGPDGEPEHDRGLAKGVDGLYFVGQHFLTSMSSAMVHGVGRDARRIAALAARG